jgi:hypothetical protein
MMKQFITIKLIPTIIFSLVVLLATVSVALADGPTVTLGKIAHAEDLAEVRYKSFNSAGDKEVYLGPSVTDVATRRQKDVKWVAGDNEVTFTYDQRTDMLTTTVRGTYVITYPNLSAQVTNSGGDPTLLEQLNVMRITVKDGRTESDVDFSNVYLNGIYLGDFGDTENVFYKEWEVQDYDFSQGFTLTGTIRLSGDISRTKSEHSRIQIEVGSLPLGSLAINKTVDWKGFTPEPSQTFEICITGPTYPNGTENGACQDMDYDGGTLIWTNLTTGDYTVTQTDAGDNWQVTGLPAQAAVGAGQSAQVHASSMYNQSTADNQTKIFLPVIFAN